VEYGGFSLCWRGGEKSSVPGTRALQRDELEMTQGYFIPMVADAITVKFLASLDGYIWSFPRCDHLSVGICGSMASHTSGDCASICRHSCKAKHFCRERAVYSHCYPRRRSGRFRSERLVGKNWALVGDAAAWVDPLTARDCFYAMRSGDCSQGVGRGQPQFIRIGSAPRLRAALPRGAHCAAVPIAEHSWNGRDHAHVQFLRRSTVFRN